MRRLLDTQQVDLPDVGQRHLDHYIITQAGHGPELRLFLDWTNRSGLTGSLKVPHTPRSEPEVALSDTQRWMHVEVLLHDDTVRLYTRVAGLFILLFAQPLSRVLRMRPEQIARSEDGTVTARFDTFPIELPEPLEELALRQLDASQNERFAGHHRKWLFPGRNAGRHLVRENIRSELVARGIHPAAGRNAALFQLAGEVPTPVLAELLGIAPRTATRWAALAARDWSHYASLRRTPPAPDPPAH